MTILNNLTKNYYQKEESLQWIVGDWGLYVPIKCNIFKLKMNEVHRQVRDKYKLNLDIPKWNQKTFSYKSLKVLGPKIWNNLPYHVKSSENPWYFQKSAKKLG